MTAGNLRKISYMVLSFSSLTLICNVQAKREDEDVFVRGGIVSSYFSLRKMESIYEGPNLVGPDSKLFKFDPDKGEDKRNIIHVTKNKKNSLLEDAKEFSQLAKLLVNKKKEEEEKLNEYYSLMADVFIKAIVPTKLQPAVDRLNQKIFRDSGSDRFPK